MPQPNSVIYFNPEAYDTSRKGLMGRHAAGESFLRGFLLNADVDAFHLINIVNRPVDELQKLVDQLGPAPKPIRWYARNQRNRMGEVGGIHLPAPGIPNEAWARRPFGTNTYSITAVTHTTCTSRVMDMMASLLIAPVESWDALICTSAQVRAGAEWQLEAVRDYLEHRFEGKAPMPQLATIPLGLTTSEFETKKKWRKEWRDKLGIPEDAVVVLFVGRLNYTSKMNPAPMAMAVEAMAKQIKKPVHWVLSGWAANEQIEKIYHDETRSACPSVGYHPVDGRVPETRRSIWSVADIFLSLSDNIQETFGLTPLEAMACGLPVVVSDWDGYRDTVRHGVDGFRVPTFTPRPGEGGDLAYRFGQEWDAYDVFVGSASQLTAVDVEITADALVRLATDPDLAKSLGEAGRRRARDVFDWRAIIPRYQELWGELHERRAHSQRDARSGVSRTNPWRPDPFSLYSIYASDWLTPTTMVGPSAGLTWKSPAELLDSPMVRYAKSYLPPADELARLADVIANGGQQRVAEVVARFPLNRRVSIERGILLLAKYGLAKLYSPVPYTANMP